ncbi:MAG: hypothetical protein CMB89_02735 [Flammeovirgaceae bacterium]|nr:hypothetical protein [Flammeovirgaceae bacterium]
MIFVFTTAKYEDYSAIGKNYSGEADTIKLETDKLQWIVLLQPSYQVISAYDLSASKRFTFRSMSRYDSFELINSATINLNDIIYTIK